MWWDGRELWMFQLEGVVTQDNQECRSIRGCNQAGNQESSWSIQGAATRENQESSRSIKMVQRAGVAQSNQGSRQRAWIDGDRGLVD